NNALADKGVVIRGDYLTDKLVAWYPAKTVIAALQLEIGVANPTVNQANRGKTGGAARLRSVSNLHTPVLEMNKNHEAVSVSGSQLQARLSHMLVFVNSDGPAVRSPNTASSKNGLRVRIALRKF